LSPTSFTQNSHRCRLALKIVAFLVVSLSPLSPLSAAAQDGQCKTRLTDLPENAELRGFRLGMSMDQVKARVPQVVFPPADELGTAKTTINPFFDPRIDKTPFADVRSISLDFFDGRLVSLWIGYDASFKWKAVDDFVKGISTALSVPANWSSWKLRGQQLRCADFEMTVSIIAGGPSFRILDLTAEDALTARRIAAEEAKAAIEESKEDTEEIVADKKTKIYYPAGCLPASEISETNRKVFSTVGAAEEAGFKRAKNCP